MTSEEKYSTEEERKAPVADQVEEQLTRKNVVPTSVVKTNAEKRFIRQLNWKLLPIIWLIIMIQFADKAAISTAAVLGMLTDTGTTGQQYSLLGSSFYIAYLVFLIPNSICMQKFPIRRYLGTLVTLWGIVLGFTAFCKTYDQLVACRVLLGVFETGTLPCVYLVGNTLYRKQEQSTFFGFSLFSTCTGMVVASLLSYAIAHMDGVHGISAWRWYYGIFGIITICIGIFTFFFLIDSPQSPILKLTPEEEEIVKERTQDNAVVPHRNINRSQHLECIREPRFWLCIIAAFVNNWANGGMVVFSVPFVASLGFSSLNAILLQVPSAAATALPVIAVVLVHRWTDSYVAASAVGCGASIVGFILLITLPHNAIKLVGYYLSWGFVGPGGILLSMVASNVIGYNKKICYFSSIPIATTLGAITGPFLMKATEAPTYKTGMILFVVSNVIFMICIGAISFLAFKTNKKRKMRGIAETIHDEKFTDQNENFLYKL